MRIHCCVEININESSLHETQLLDNAANSMIQIFKVNLMMLSSYNTLGID